jgi:hypothetical protein
MSLLSAGRGKACHTVPNLDLVERGMQASTTVKLCAFIPYAGNTTKQAFTIQRRAQSCSLVRRRKPLHAPVAVDVSELDGFDDSDDGGYGATSLPPAKVRKCDPR